MKSWGKQLLLHFSLMATLCSVGCGSSSDNTTGVDIPTSDEYLGSSVGCDFFFDQNFLMERQGIAITLTVPATGASVEADLQPDNTFSFQVEDGVGNTANCIGEFTAGDDMNFDCVVGEVTCDASYSRNPEG